jgi:hypothetical protein
LNIKESAKIITSKHYNWVDTLVIALCASSLQFLKYIILKNPDSITDGVFGALTVFPLLFLLYNYVVHIRPILFSNSAINFILLLPKDVDHRPRFTLLGLMATLFQWVGCMLIITSTINSPLKTGEFILSSDQSIAVKAKQEAERLYLQQELKNIAEAKPLDVTKLSPGEAQRMVQQARQREENPDQEEKNIERYKQNFIAKKIEEITPTLKDEVHKEEKENFKENRKHQLEMFWKQVMWGMVVLFLGAIIEKINNIIQASLAKKRGGSA